MMWQAGVQVDSKEKSYIELFITSRILSTTIVIICPFARCLLDVLELGL